MKKQNFIKGSLILMISAVVAKGLGALFKIPLTNMLGGVGMGYFSCAYSIFMPVYALTVTGLSSAVARMVAENMALRRYDNIRRIRFTALVLFSLFGLVGSLLIFFLAKPFSIFSSGEEDSFLAVAMISPTVFFGCVTAVGRGYYEGMSNMYPTALSQAVEGVVKVVAGLSLCGYVNSHGGEIMAHFPEISDIRAVAAAAGVLGVTLSSVGSMIFFGVLALFRKKMSGGDSSLMGYGEISKELILTSLPTGISAVVTNLTALIDMFTIIGFISRYGCNMKIPPDIAERDAAGFVYGSFAGIALTVFNLVPSVTNMLGKGVLPCVTESWAEGDRDGLRRHTMQALLTASLIAVPSAFGIFVLSPEILRFLFSRQRDEAEICINSLRLLMPGMVCLCLSFPLFSMMQAIGKASSPLKIMIVGTVVKLVGNLVLIPFMGSDGAALSTSVCYVIILVVSLSVYIKSSGVPIDSAPFLSVIYAGLLCAASSYLVADISSRHGLGDFAVIGISAIFGGGVYIISLWLLSVKRYGEQVTL